MRKYGDINVTLQSDDTTIILSAWRYVPIWAIVFWTRLYVISLHIRGM